MDEYRQGWAARAELEPEDEIIKSGMSLIVFKSPFEFLIYVFLSGVSPDNIRKWKVLQSVQDRNETLFYR